MMLQPRLGLRAGTFFLFAFGLWTLAQPPVRAQVPADQAADMLLNSARKAYNEQNLPFAATKFSEFLQKFGGHPQANAARYGLALCYLDGPERNFEKAIEPLNPLVGNTALPEQPYAVYYLGIAKRGLALNDLALAATKQGSEQQQIQQRAQARFGEAAGHFAAATSAFTTKVGKIEGMPKELPKELDWAARSRADQAEMELRIGKIKEAKATSEPFTKDPLLARNRYGKLGLYYHGFASFLLQDYLVAGRSLNQLNPFDDPTFGLHARYLMGRIYQITEEPDKALTAYDKVLADYDKQKKDAIEAMKRPDLLKNNPTERERVEGLAKNPPPDHVAASTFYSACLQYEGGKFGEALGRFQAFAKDFPNSPLQPEAALRVGYCQVQLKQYAEAGNTLTPLVDKNPRLADQILFWLGKAQAGVALAADAANPQARDNGLKTALATLKGAADRAGAMIANDPDAKIRRAEIVLETADVQQLAKMHKEAAALYEQLLNEKAIPARVEETTQRLISALHLAGDYGRSDQLCVAFQKEFPRSPLLPIVSFRMAENAYFTALAAEKRPDFPNKAVELPKLFDEAAKRYKLLIERYPEFERIHLARYGLAMCHFKKNEYEAAAKALEAIPLADRSGDLANAPYLLAECLIRLAPEKAEDALAVGMLTEKLSQAQQNLDAFISSNPKAPEVPDAMLKLGVCQTRLALQLANPPERNQALTAARATFDKLIQAYPKEIQGMQAVLERAKCQAAQGDKGGAINELRKFTTDPLQQTPIAPIAVLHLATLMREQNQADQAAQMLNAARQRHEPGLKDNPERIALLRYHHGICLQEANKPAEARAQLETIPQIAQGKPIAVEAALRSGQCRIVEAKLAIENARKLLAMGNLKSEQLQQANTSLSNGFNALNDAAQTLQTRAEEFKATQPNYEARARMYYDAAWAWRILADQEIAKAKTQMQLEKQKQLQAEADKKAAPGTKASAVPMPDIDRASVPLQPSEGKARNVYQILIGAFPDILMSVEARFELAEMMAERNEHDPAIKLLQEALDKEPADNKSPTPELIDKMRIRLGSCFTAKKMHKEALEKFAVVADNPKSPLVAQGLYRAGECHLDLGENDKAIARFMVFRDKGEFHNVPGVSDRALLRLGHAYAAAKQWEPSRQAMEVLTQRYGNSPWIHDARYGMGWALQNAGQFDPAVNAYNAVIANTASELAAKAHLQIGLCRLEQKRWGDAVGSLLVVPFTFDYPELSAAALTEASRALIEDKKPEQAERLLKRVIKDYPQSEWAKVAQTRLDGLSKTKTP